MKRRTSVALATVFSTLLLATCIAYGPPDDTPKPVASQEQTTMTVRVENHGFYDATVYVLSGQSIVQRLGSVGSLGSADFVIRVGPLGTQIALYARTLAENVVYRSGPIDVIPGLGLRWQLGPQKGVEWLSMQADSQ